MDFLEKNKRLKFGGLPRKKAQNGSVADKLGALGAMPNTAPPAASSSAEMQSSPNNDRVVGMLSEELRDSVNPWNNQELIGIQDELDPSVAGVATRGLARGQNNTGASQASQYENDQDRDGAVQQQALSSALNNQMAREVAAERDTQGLIDRAMPSASAGENVQNPYTQTRTYNDLDVGQRQAAKDYNMRVYGTHNPTADAKSAGLTKSELSNRYKSQQSKAASAPKAASKKKATASKAIKSMSAPKPALKKAAAPVKKATTPTAKKRKTLSDRRSSRRKKIENVTNKIKGAAYKVADKVASKVNRKK
jgi:hypothetical protein